LAQAVWALQAIALLLSCDPLLRTGGPMPLGVLLFQAFPIVRV